MRRASVRSAVSLSSKRGAGVLTKRGLKHSVPKYSSGFVSKYTTTNKWINTNTRYTVIVSNSTSNYSSYRSYAGGLPSHTVLELPALSPTMETGGILEWAKKEGDEIAAGDVIAEIETDKTNISWTSTEDGYLAKILVPAGSKGIAINSPVAIFVTDEADIAAFKNYTGEAASAPAAPKEQPKSAPAPTPTPAAPQAQAAAPAPTPAPSTPSSGRVTASPFARKLAEEKGVNLSGVSGTGPNNRIIAADVREYTPSRQAVPQASAPVVESSAASYTDIPTTAMRKIIAQRLTEAKQTIPHYYLSTECKIDNLLKLREEWNKKGDGKYKLSVNDFIVKASAMALRKVPEVNSSWRGDYIRKYNNVDVCVAVNTPEGLFTPIVASADGKGLVSISNKVKELAAKAKDKKLAPEEYQGGTFTISNLGMMGISSFAAVINPPQSCILAVGSTEKKVVVKSGTDSEFEVASVMAVTLSCDHRVVDGAVGAQWLKHFKDYVEDPVKMLL